MFTTFTFELPPQPPWEGLHPLVIHFPIALLFITPVFVLLAAFLGKHGRWFGLTALMLLVMGTVSGAVAVSSGNAAFHAMESVEDGGWEVAEEHQQAAQEVQIMFIGLTFLYAVLFAIPLVIAKWNVRRYWLLTKMSSDNGEVGVTNSSPTGSPSIRAISAQAVVSDASQIVRQPWAARPVMSERSMAACAGLARWGSSTRPKSTSAAASACRAAAAAEKSASVAAVASGSATAVGVASSLGSGRSIAGSNAKTMSATASTSSSGHRGTVLMRRRPTRGTDQRPEPIRGKGTQERWGQCNASRPLAASAKMGGKKPVLL